MVRDAAPVSIYGSCAAMPAWLVVSV